MSVKPSRASVRNKEPRILGPAEDAKKRKFACGCKAPNKIQVSFGTERVYALELPESKDCFTHRQAEILKIDLCATCRQPRLERFGQPHVHVQASQAPEATATPEPIAEIITPTAASVTA